MQRLVERTGVGPDIRPGGITVDTSVFSPNAPAYQRVENSVSPFLLVSGSQLNTLQAGGILKTVFGPAFFQSLNVFPNSSRFIWSVNLGNNTVNFAQAGIAG